MESKKKDKKVETESELESSPENKDGCKSGVCDEVSELKSTLEKLREEIDQQKEKFLRIAAEYDNYRKRTERDKSSIYYDTVAKTVEEILPVADSLRMAVSSDSGSNDDYKKGLKLVNSQFVSALEKLSVESFGEAGEEFDPKFHNAIAHVDSDEFDENVIIEVFQPGYKVGDKVIRHAIVKVAN